MPTSPGTSPRLRRASPRKALHAGRDEAGSPGRYNLRDSPRKDYSDQDSSVDSVDYVYSRSPVVTRRKKQGQRARGSPEPDEHDTDQASDKSAGEKRGGLYPGLPASPDSSPGLYPDISHDLRDAKIPSRTRKTNTIEKKVFESSTIQTDKVIYSSKARGASDEWLQWVFSNIWVVLLFIALVVIFLLIYNSSSTAHIEPPVMDSEEEAYRRQQMVKEFTKEMGSLKKLYEKQDDKLWKILHSATKRVLLDANPIQPAVIILAFNADSSKTSSCLAQAYMELIRRVTSKPTFHIDIPGIKSRSSDDLKLTVDNQLSAGFENGAESAWLKDIHRLDGSAAMLLHAYCDNENAPHKKATIVMTMDSNHKGSMPSSQWDALVEEALVKLWQDEIGVDNLHALLSRVANNIAVVDAESDNSLKNACTAM